MSGKAGTSRGKTGKLWKNQENRENLGKTMKVWGKPAKLVENRENLSKIEEQIQ